MAPRHKPLRMGHGTDWNIDDLQDLGLDRMLRVPDEAVNKSAALSSSPTESNMLLAYTTKWIPIPSTKRDESRPSFFDLPAEIRMTIYDFYRASLLRDFDLTDMRWPVHLFNFHADYLAPILRTQLICHQFRAEMVPFWTQNMTLLLSYPVFTEQPEHLSARIAQLKRTWFHVRHLLNWLGPARQDFHTIRICYIYKLRSRLSWHGHLQVLRAVETLDLASSLERLVDVHKDLKVEVELRCNGSNDIPYIPARRVLTFRQRPFGRGTRSDWICDNGKLERMRDESYFLCMEEVNQRPHFRRCRDEVWTVVR